jgi:RHS repeat-associated protein
MERCGPYTTVETGISLNVWGTSGVSGRGYAIDYHTVNDPTTPDTTTNYYTADALGSERMMTSVNGYPVWQAMYAAFGNEVSPQMTMSDYKFAGLTRDPTTSLDQAMLGTYSSTINRWMTPDPLGGDISNPQSLNRYSYALNNPTTLTDPLGLTAIDCSQSNVICTTSTASGGNGGFVGLGSIDPDLECFFDFSPCGYTQSELSGYNSAYFFGGYVPPTGGGGGSAPPPKPAPPPPQAPTPAQAATNYCQQHGQLSFNIPFTHVPVTVGFSATGFFSFSTTNDIGITFPPSAGASLDITVGAPSGPSIPVAVGSGKNLSVGTFLTPSGAKGFSASFGPSIGSPVTISPPITNACGLKAGGG